MLWYGPWYSMVQYGTVWYSMVQYGTVWYSMVQYGTVWYGMVFHAMPCMYASMHACMYGSSIRVTRMKDAIKVCLMPSSCPSSRGNISFHHPQSLST